MIALHEPPHVATPRQLPSRVRIVIVDEEALIASALRALLAPVTGIEVVAATGDLRSVLPSLRENRVDILMVDMATIRHIELSELLLRHRAPCRVIVVASGERPSDLQRALKHHVDGYVTRSSQMDSLVHAIKTVAAGSRFVDPSLLLSGWDTDDPLNDREHGVLGLAAAGMSSSRIGDTLGLTPGTVRNYLSSAIRKTGASNRIEAAAKARERGWL